MFKKPYPQPRNRRGKNKTERERVGGKNGYVVEE
jgi:hypothetical protein